MGLWLVLLAVAILVPLIVCATAAAVLELKERRMTDNNKPKPINDPTELFPIGNGFLGKVITALIGFLSKKR
jgi:hypothetical protein